MKVRISASAASFLKQESAYLRRHAPAAAERFLAAMRDARLQLGRFPQLGRPLDERGEGGLRRLIVGGYIMDYRGFESEVRILSVRHGRQDEPRSDEPDS